MAALAEAFGFPSLLRTPSTHGGDAFEKIDAPGGIDAFLSQHPAPEYYVTEFVDSTPCWRGRH